MPLMYWSCNSIVEPLTRFLNAVTETFSELSEAADKSGGVAQWFGGEANLEAFGEPLKAFGEGIKGFGDAVDGLNADAVQNAVPAGEALTELSKTIPKDGGAMGWLNGDLNMAQFGRELYAFGNSLKNFGDAVNGLNIDAINAAVPAGKALTELAESLPTSGGAFEWLTGRGNFTSFSEQISAFGKGLSGLSSSLVAVDPGKIEASAKAAAALSELEKALPESGGLFSGKTSLSDFGKTLAIFGEGFGKYCEEIGNVNLTTLDTASKATASLVTISKDISSVNSDSIKNFSASLENLAQVGVNGFADTLKNSDTEVANAVGKLLDGASSELARWLSHPRSRDTNIAIRTTIRQNRCIRRYSLYKRAATEWRGEIMYYTNFPSDLPESYDPVRSRAVGKTFREGTIERKGLGEIEIGEFIDYTGKMGAQRFFVFGLQYEWSGASFDETIYSFAPDYRGVDYEWMNDRDLVADEDKEDEPKEEEKPETPEVSESGVSIDQAVIIKEADAKHLLHNFTEVEYNAGNKIGYTGPGNQIVLQGYLAYTTAALNAGANYVSGTQIHYPADWTTDVSRYMEFAGDFYSGTTHYKRIYIEPSAMNASNATYNIYFELADGTIQRSYVTLSNADHWSGVGLALEWINIYPPGSVISNVTYENGYAMARFHYFWKSNFSQDYVYDRWYINSIYNIPFTSLAEYQAAVGLTYEPLTLARVEDNPTVVSGSEVN